MSAQSADSAASRRLAERCAHWLLDGPAQLADGPEAGAVVGVVGGEGIVPYAYPEITGYYLHWLAGRALTDRHASIDRPGLAARALAIQDWLRRRLASGRGLPTRIYLQAAPPDWRNDACFVFDLGMVLRGLATATRAALLAPDAAVVVAVVECLESLVGSDGQLRACAPLRPGAELPERWSTQAGPFLAKAAAAVLEAATVLPDVSPRLQAAADATLAASRSALASAGVTPVHPLLYALEGGVAGWADSRVKDLPALRRALGVVLRAVDATGRLPETVSLSPAGPAAPIAGGRLDIVAQALRLGRVLARLDPEPPPDPEPLARLRACLRAGVTADGAVAFDAGRPRAGLCVWATLFAEQALAADGWETDSSNAAGSPVRPGQASGRGGPPELPIGTWLV